MKLRRLLRWPPVPPRVWIRAADGSYYRNYPLIRAERDKVFRWPLLTPGRLAVLDDLLDEGHAVLLRGVQRKHQLDPEDVAVEEHVLLVARPPVIHDCRLDWTWDPPGPRRRR